MDEPTSTVIARSSSSTIAAWTKIVALKKMVSPTRRTNFVRMILTRKCIKSTEPLLPHKSPKRTSIAPKRWKLICNNWLTQTHSKTCQQKAKRKVKFCATKVGAKTWMTTWTRRAIISSTWAMVRSSVSRALKQRWNRTESKAQSQTLLRRRTPYLKCSTAMGSVRQEACQDLQQWPHSRLLKKRLLSIA